MSATQFLNLPKQQPTTKKFMDIYYEFGEYYDLIYRRKDYKKECAYVDKLFLLWGRKKPKTVLDLGCGTGSHMIPFLQRGASIVGLDQSSVMLDFARQKVSNYKNRAKLYQKDITSFRLSQTFDAVLAMFSVTNYMVTDKSLLNMFRNAAWHMKPKALFILDFWHDSAVENYYSPSRDRLYKFGSKFIRRQSNTTLDKKTRTSTVSYTFTLMDKTRTIKETTEKQHLRYFSIDELTFFLNKCGLKPLDAHPFMHTYGKIKKNTWDITIVAEKA